MVRGEGLVLQEDPVAASRGSVEGQLWREHRERPLLPIRGSFRWPVRASTHQEKVQVDRQAVHQRHLLRFGSCISEEEFRRLAESNEIWRIKRSCQMRSERTDHVGHELLDGVFGPGPGPRAQSVAVRPPAKQLTGSTPISHTTPSTQCRILQPPYILAHLSSSSSTYFLAFLG